MKNGACHQQMITVCFGEKGHSISPERRLTFLPCCTSLDPDDPEQLACLLLPEYFNWHGSCFFAL